MNRNTIEMDAKMTLKILLLLLATFVMITFIGSALTTTARAQGSQQWTIAVAGSMSGSSVHLGQAIVDAAQIRVDQLSALRRIVGNTITLQTYDDQKLPEVDAEIAQNDSIFLVLGHRTSGAFIAAGPVFLANEIPAISCTATADGVSRGNS